MTTDMSETFSIALRDLLVEQVQSSADPQRSRLGMSSRWTIRVGAALIIAVGGGGIAYATGVFTTTPPGGPLVTDLAQPVTVTGTGTQTVQLGTQPHGTNAIAISFTCLTAGDFTFADGSGIDCATADLAGGQANTTTGTMPITPGQDSTTITATPGARWRLTAIYSAVTTTAWGVNASGQTYGTANQHGTPDLVAVDATNGRTGYVYATQLTSPAPTSPSQAVAENNSPPKTLTVYDSDGKTPIGKFVARTGPAAAQTTTTAATPPTTNATTSDARTTTP
jgi:hypothetical protein